MHYIQDNGHLNYTIILKALHSLVNSHSSIRVCEAVMNNMACLFDMGIFDKRIRKKRPVVEQENVPPIICKRRTQSRSRKGKSNNQSPLAPPRIDAQRSSLGSTLQIGSGPGIGRRDRRVSMMINQGNYQAPKELSGPSQSDDDVSDESRSKSVPSLRPTRIDKHSSGTTGKVKTEKAGGTEADTSGGNLSNNDIAMEIVLK